MASEVKAASLSLIDQFLTDHGEETGVISIEDLARLHQVELFEQKSDSKSAFEDGDIKENDSAKALYAAAQADLEHSVPEDIVNVIPVTLLPALTHTSTIQLFEHAWHTCSFFYPVMNGTYTFVFLADDVIWIQQHRDHMDVVDLRKQTWHFAGLRDAAIDIVDTRHRAVLEGKEVDFKLLRTLPKGYLVPLIYPGPSGTVQLLKLAVFPYWTKAQIRLNPAAEFLILCDRGSVLNTADDAQLSSAYLPQISIGPSAIAARLLLEWKLRDEQTTWVRHPNIYAEAFRGGSPTVLNARTTAKKKDQLAVLLNYMEFLRFEADSLCDGDTKKCVPELDESVDDDHPYRDANVSCFSGLVLAWNDQERLARSYKERSCDEILFPSVNNANVPYFVSFRELWVNAHPTEKSEDFKSDGFAIDHVFCAPEMVVVRWLRGTLPSKDRTDSACVYHTMITRSRFMSLIRVDFAIDNKKFVYFSIAKSPHVLVLTYFHQRVQTIICSPGLGTTLSQTEKLALVQWTSRLANVWVYRQVKGNGVSDFTVPSKEYRSFSYSAEKAYLQAKGDAPSTLAMLCWIESSLPNGFDNFQLRFPSRDSRETRETLQYKNTAWPCRWKVYESEAYPDCLWICSRKRPITVLKVPDYTRFASTVSHFGRDAKKLRIIPLVANTFGLRNSGGLFDFATNDREDSRQRAVYYSNVLDFKSVPPIPATKSKTTREVAENAILPYVVWLHSSATLLPQIIELTNDEVRTVYNSLVACLAYNPNDLPMSAPEPDAPLVASLLSASPVTSLTSAAVLSSVAPVLSASAAIPSSSSSSASLSSPSSSSAAAPSSSSAADSASLPASLLSSLPSSSPSLLPSSPSFASVMASLPQSSVLNIPLAPLHPPVSFAPIVTPPLALSAPSAVPASAKRGTGHFSPPLRPVAPPAVWRLSVDLSVPLAPTGMRKLVIPGSVAVDPPSATPVDVSKVSLLATDGTARVDAFDDSAEEFTRVVHADESAPFTGEGDFHDSKSEAKDNNKSPRKPAKKPEIHEQLEPAEQTRYGTGFHASSFRESRLDDSEVFGIGADEVLLRTLVDDVDPDSRLEASEFERIEQVAFAGMLLLKYARVYRIWIAWEMLMRNYYESKSDSSWHKNPKWIDCIAGKPTIGSCIRVLSSLDWFAICNLFPQICHFMEQRYIKAAAKAADKGDDIDLSVLISVVESFKNMKMDAYYELLQPDSERASYRLWSSGQMTETMLSEALRRECIDSQIEWLLMRRRTSNRNPQLYDCRIWFDMKPYYILPDDQQKAFTLIKDAIVKEKYLASNIGWSTVRSDGVLTTKLATLRRNKRYWFPEYLAAESFTGFRAANIAKHCSNDYTIPVAQSLKLPAGFMFDTGFSDVLRNIEPEAFHHVFDAISTQQLRFASERSPTPVEVSKKNSGLAQHIKPFQIHWTQVVAFVVLLFGQSRPLHRIWPRYDESVLGWAQSFRKDVAHGASEKLTPIWTARYARLRRRVDAIQNSKRSRLLLVDVFQGDQLPDDYNDTVLADWNEVLKYQSHKDAVAVYISFPNDLLALLVPAQDMHLAEIVFIAEKMTTEWCRSVMALAKLRGDLLPYEWSTLGRDTVSNLNLMSVARTSYWTVGAPSPEEVDYVMHQLLYGFHHYYPISVPFHPDVQNQWTYVEELIHMWPGMI